MLLKPCLVTTFEVAFVSSLAINPSQILTSGDNGIPTNSTQVEVTGNPSNQLLPLSITGSGINTTFFTGLSLPEVANFKYTCDAGSYGAPMFDACNGAYQWMPSEYRFATYGDRRNEGQTYNAPLPWRVTNRK